MESVEFESNPGCIMRCPISNMEMWKGRGDEGKCGNEGCELSQAGPAHLAPLLEDFIAQTVHFFDFANVRRDNEHILLAHDPSDLFRSSPEQLFVVVRKSNPKTDTTGMDRTA